MADGSWPGRWWLGARHRGLVGGGKAARTGIVPSMARQYIVMTIGVVAVSFAALFIRLADAPPFVIGTYRLALASLLMLPFGYRQARREIPFLSVQDLSLMLIAGVCLALHFGLWITSLSLTSVTTSVVLVTASPIFIAVASRLLFGERLRRPAIAGIVISLAGAALISLGNWKLGGQSLRGSLLALGGAVAISGYLLIGRRLRSRVGIFTYSSTVYTTAALMLLAVAVVLRKPLTGYSGSTYLLMVLLALIPQLVGHSSLNWALRFVPATFVAVSVLGEPVGATLWAFAFLSEAPSMWEIAGGVLVLTGIFIAVSNASQGRDRSSPKPVQ
jgi:drug/metabolite transporter (DMT)-like permease